MGLLDFWRRYDRGALIVNDSLARERFARFSPIFDFKDNNYLQMEDENLRAFVYKYWDIHDLLYHWNSGEFPDCDDFARIVFGHILTGAIRERFQFAPCLGVVDLRIGGGVMHEQIWAIAKGPKDLLFEPQNGTWQGIERVEMMRMVSA